MIISFYVFFSKEESQTYILKRSCGESRIGSLVQSIRFLVSKNFEQCLPLMVFFFLYLRSFSPREIPSPLNNDENKDHFTVFLHFMYFYIVLLEDSFKTAWTLPIYIWLYPLILGFLDVGVSFTGGWVVRVFRTVSKLLIVHTVFLPHSRLSLGDTLFTLVMVYVLLYGQL